MTKIEFALTGWAVACLMAGTYMYSLVRPVFSCLLVVDLRARSTVNNLSLL